MSVLTYASRRTSPTRGFSAGSKLRREVAVVLAVALALGLGIKTFLVQPYKIPSLSMYPTLMIGDKVLASRLPIQVGSIKRGDVVVFRDPGGWLPAPPLAPGGIAGAVDGVLKFIGVSPRNANSTLVKRVIGLPGDRVICCDVQGRIVVNGVSVQEPYIAPGNVPSTVNFDVTLQPGYIWVLGDNRGNSADSRFHQGALGAGGVPIANVQGRVVATVFPLTRIGVSPSNSVPFGAVPPSGLPVR